MTVTATDADEGIFAEIAYSIVEQSPSWGRNMFYINAETGQIYVQLNTLDREVITYLTRTVKSVRTIDIYNSIISMVRTR